MQQRELRQWLSSDRLPGGTELAAPADEAAHLAELHPQTERRIQALASDDEHFADPREQYILKDDRYYDLERSTLLAQRPVRDGDRAGYELLYESPEGNYFTYRQMHGNIQVVENMALSLFGSGLLLIPLVALPHTLLAQISAGIPPFLVMAVYILLSGGIFTAFSYSDYSKGRKTDIEEEGKPLLRFSRMTDAAARTLSEQMQDTGIEDSNGHRLLKWGKTFLAFDNQGRLHHIERNRVKKLALRSDRTLAHALFPELEEG